MGCAGSLVASSVVSEEGSNSTLKSVGRGKKGKSGSTASTAIDGAAPSPCSSVSTMGSIPSSLIVKYLGDPELSPKLSRLLAVKELHPDNLMAKHFDLSYFDTLARDKQLALLKICNSGIENPDSSMGCYATNPNDYDDFKPFFKKIICDYHKVGEDAQQVNDWSLKSAEDIPKDGKLDLAALGLPALSMRVRVGRNLADFPLPAAMTVDDRKKMEEKMCTAFEKLNTMDGYGGKYHSLTPEHASFIDDAAYDKLVKEHLMFKSMADDVYLASAGIASDWPIGRGCYVSNDRNFIIWVSEEDHLRIMVMQSGTVLNTVFDRLKDALDVVESIEGLTFAKSEWAGIITSCPTNLGTGMRASVHIALPNLTRDGTDKKAKQICKPLGLSVRGTGGEHTPIGADGTVDISPSARFHIKEGQIVAALYKGLQQLKESEDREK